MRWRLGLVAVVAMAVLGGLVPHAVVAGAVNSTVSMVQAIEAPISGTSCSDATCGKGSPTPASPSPAGAMAVVLGGLAVVAAGATLMRRHIGRATPLPAGKRDPLYHPPQFS